MKNGIQYYGIVDLENDIDGGCWVRGDNPDKTFYTQKQQWKEDKLLSSNRISAEEWESGIVDENKVDSLLQHISDAVDSIAQSIIRKYGGTQEELCRFLCMTFLVPFKADDTILALIRNWRKEKGIRRVCFIAKEAAAALYMKDYERSPNFVFLLFDAGEDYAAVSAVESKEDKIHVLNHRMDSALGAHGLDTAFVNYLFDIFGDVFRRFRTERELFRKLWMEWKYGRIFMEGELPIYVNVEDFMTYARRKLKSVEYKQLEKAVIGEYARYISLSSEDIAKFAGSLLDKIWTFLADAQAAMETETKETTEVLISGSYLNMPPVRKYFEVRQKSARWRMPKMDPNACLKGALIFTKKKEGLQLTGTLKRTWGIIMRESGEMHFEVLIPGGERIFWGYKKEIFVAPADGSESSVIIRLCSIPACYFPKYDDSALICEKELCVRSDKSMFPARKLQISIQVADTLFIELHDLITGNKESAMLEVEWEHGPDLLI